MSETKRILLFGNQGQVGHRLQAMLTQAGYDVTGMDHEQCDLARADAKTIAIMLRAVEPMLVINAAAYTAVDLAEQEAELAACINAQVPKTIAQVAQEEGIPFLHFSTDYVFDGISGAPYREGASINPLNAYAQTKAEGEAAVRAHGAYVFRLQWVFDTRGRNFFLTMQKLLRERTELRIVADQLGSPSYVPHITQAITRAVPHMLRGALAPAVYHLTASGFTSWHGFACAIAHSLESRTIIYPIVSSEYPTPAARPKDTRLDCSTLAAQGIVMPHWREGLAAAMKVTG